MTKFYVNCKLFFLVALQDWLKVNKYTSMHQQTNTQTCHEAQERGDGARKRDIKAVTPRLLNISLPQISIFWTQPGVSRSLCATAVEYIYLLFR